MHSIFHNLATRNLLFLIAQSYSKALSAIKIGKQFDNGTTVFELEKEEIMCWMCC